MGEQKNTWFYLDADNNRKDPDSPHCARCKKKMKDTQAFENFTPIIFHVANPWYRIAGAFEKAQGLIGTECHKKAIKINS